MILKEIPLSRLKASASNPRKRFDEAKMQELLESVKSLGIMTPLLTRPWWCVGLTDRATVEATLATIDPEKWGGDFEVVAGERRLRTANAANLAEAPCIVRYLCDDDALELQLVENLQREDLSIREEAEGYAALLSLKNEDGSDRFTYASIGDRIGRTPAYVEQRVKILCVPVEALEAVDAGRIFFAHLRLLSRIPSPSARESATKELLHPLYQAEPLSTRDFASHLRDRYMVTIKAPAFAMDDAELVPVECDAAGVRICGGACSDCPFLNTNNPELSDIDPGSAKPICTNPPCYQRKMDAAWEEARSAALKDGKRVLSEAEADKVFAHGGTSLPHNSPYVELSEQVPADALASNVKRAPSWKKLLNGIPTTPQTVLVADSGNGDAKNAGTLVEKVVKLVKPEIVVVRDARGGIHELVNRGQAFAAHSMAVKAGKSSPVFREDVKSAGRVDHEGAKKRAEAEAAKIETAVAMAEMAALHKQISNVGIVSEDSFFKQLFELAMYHASADAFWWIAKRLKIQAPEAVHSGRDYQKGLREHWKGIGAKERIAVILELLLAGALRHNGPEAPPFTPWLALYEVDAKKIRASVEAELAQKKNGKKKNDAPPADESIVEAAADVASQAPEETAEKPPTLTGRILEFLASAGPDGANVRQIAEAVARNPQSVHVWLSTTGKQHPEIQKVGAERYALCSAALADGPETVPVSADSVSALDILERDLIEGPLPSHSWPATEFTAACSSAPDKLLEAVLKNPRFSDAYRRMLVLEEIGRRVKSEGEETLPLSEEPIENHPKIEEIREKFGDVPAPADPPPLELTPAQRQSESIVLAIRSKDIGLGVALAPLAASLGLAGAEVLQWWAGLTPKARKALGIRKTGMNFFAERGTK
jgi:ParB/RepB/Spo0J family partition protein